MKAFSDSCGRSWLAVVNCNTLRRVQAATGINLGDFRNIIEVCDRLRADDLFVGEVALSLCADQIEKAEVKPADFLGSLRGDCIEAAADAVMDGIVGFFRNGPTREAAQKMMTHAKDLQAGVVKALLTSGASATNTPASAA